jgi:hypothetical protein
LRYLGELLGLDDRQAWDQALQGVPHAFGHTWENCMALHLATGSEVQLYVYSKGASRALCPLVKRRSHSLVDVITPFGFAGFVGQGELSSLPSVWRAFAQNQGWVAGFIQVNPLLPSPYPLVNSEYRVYKSIFSLDLRKKEAELFSQLSSSRRSSIRRWSREGVRFIEDKASVIDFGTRELPAFLKRKGGGSGVPCFGKESWEILLNHPNAVAIAAEFKGQICAVNVVVFTPYVGDEFLLVSLSGFESISMAIKWEGMLCLKKYDVERVNIGGGITAGDGVEYFKRTLGGEELPLGALRQVYDQQAFDRLCESAGVAPNLQSYFPPYRAPKPERKSEGRRHKR